MGWCGMKAHHSSLVRHNSRELDKSSMEEMPSQDLADIFEVG